MCDDPLDLVRIVTEFLERGFDGLVDNLEHSAAREQLVFHERDVRFNSGRIAIHQKTNRARRRKHCDLRVAIAVLFA